MTSEPKPEKTAPARPLRKTARRPKWLPQEFAKPEELVRAYKQLKTAPSAQEPALRPQPEPTAAPDSKSPEQLDLPLEPPAPVYPGDAAEPEPELERAPMDEAARARDFTAFETEFCETGGLCVESYAQLEALGAPRWLVDRHIEGRIAVAEAARREILELIGGEERFDAMLAWARESLPMNELAAYEKAIKGGKEEAKLAVLGLAAAYDRAVGEAPKLIGGGAGPTTAGPFSNADELAQAIRDPRYRSDPTYRAEIVARLAQRRVFE